MATATMTSVKTNKTNGTVKPQANGKADLSQKSLVGDFHWNDVMIGETVGKGLTKRFYQRRTALQYAALSTIGLFSFYQNDSPALKAMSLGFLFPGAGLVAVGTIPSLLSFVVSTAAIPVVIFMWFGCGGVAFPMSLWIGSTLLAGFLARDSVWEVAAPVWTAVCVAGIGYLWWVTRAANLAAEEKRKVRNTTLVENVKQNQASAVQPKPGSREVDEKTLRFVQWHLELGLASLNDFSYHDIIDQFQTSAIRYQLYEAVYALGLYQRHYTPNFHGYLSQAQRNCIDKSTSTKVVGFWKWESIFGKFRISGKGKDWDPVVKDNIMVTGYILEAIGIYQSNTGDTRYMKDDSLEFKVTKDKTFKYNFQGVAEAVYRNMDENDFCLYPCEPNWLYTPCNLVGIGGIVAADRLLKKDYGDKLRGRFERALEEEFSSHDGSILPIRSELTGFTIPGLCGVLTDAVNSMLCAAYLPHIAHRNWAMARSEAVKYDENGKMDIVNLTGADLIDPGNYKAGVGCIRAIFAAAAAEFGDVQVRDDCLKQVDEEYHPVITTSTGAFKNKGLSTLEQGTCLKARLAGYQDWTTMMQQEPPQNVREGPLLEQVAFPNVLVAKAYSQDGESLDLVLYNGKEAGNFQLGFARLAPGMKYKLGSGEAVADSTGVASFTVTVDGRTPLQLTPVRG